MGIILQKHIPFPDSLSKTKLTVHLIRVGSISKLSAGCIVTPRSMHGITSLESRSILSAKYPNLATCFDFSCLKPIVLTVSSSASPNSISAVPASAASSSYRPHPKKIINSSVTFTYYHLRCQERVGLANHTRPFLSAGAYTASDNALR